MNDSEAVEKLSRVYSLSSTSLVRYLVEAAGLELRDDWDRRAFAFYETYNRDSTAALTRIAEVLREKSCFPGPGPWNLEFSQFNYVSASHMLRPVATRVEKELVETADASRGIEGWPAAEDAVRSLIQRGRKFIDDVSRLESERPHLPPTPARIKGTSASRW
jgi:hypothetical protein